MSKQKRDEVIKYLKNGYTIKETAEKTTTSSGYVSKINKEITQKTENTQPSSIQSTLSEESIQILYNIQGLYGCKNLDETVSKLNEDIITIMPRKYEFNFGFNKTISEVFEDMYKKLEENKITKKSMTVLFKQKIMIGYKDLF
jgi:hypothetical protein